VYRTVTLTTDFGVRDPYVAAMKGVLLDICPNVRIVDLTHEIGPQNIAEGALFLAGAVPYFPKETIHVAVIDPGVGTERRPIVLRTLEQYIVCPDNGLAALLVRQSPWEARVISNSAFMRDTISPTFHGRDIFAPAAAHLASGAPFDQVGSPIESLVTLAWPEPTVDASGAIHGQVVHVDRFGNLITNIHHSMVREPASASVHLGAHALDGIQSTYGELPLGKPLTLFGSSGYLEIAVNSGSAAEAFAAAAGEHVTVTLTAS